MSRIFSVMSLLHVLLRSSRFLKFSSCCLQAQQSLPPPDTCLSKHKPANHSSCCPHAVSLVATESSYTLWNVTAAVCGVQKSFWACFCWMASLWAAVSPAASPASMDPTIDCADMNPSPCRWCCVGFKKHWAKLFLSSTVPSLHPPLELPALQQHRCAAAFLCENASSVLSSSPLWWKDGFVFISSGFQAYCLTTCGLFSQVVNPAAVHWHTCAYIQWQRWWENNRNGEVFENSSFTQMWQLLSTWV